MNSKTVLSFVKPKLLLWQLRQLFLINAAAMVIAGLYTLLRAEPMVAPGELRMLMAVIVHSAAVVWVLGRVSSRHVGFLHAQGFTRDQIGWHTFLASLLSAVLVCSTVLLLMVTGLRSFVADHVFESPWFPFMASGEYSLPFILLLGYAIVLPLMHYAWVRFNQPFGGAASGWMMMISGLVFLIWSGSMLWMHRLETTFLLVVAVSYVPGIILLTVACWRLHRTMEVRS